MSTTTTTKTRQCLKCPEHMVYVDAAPEERENGYRGHPPFWECEGCGHTEVVEPEPRPDTPWG